MRRYGTASIHYYFRPSAHVSMQTNTTQLVLSNGAKVIIKSTDELVEGTHSPPHLLSITCHLSKSRAACHLSPVSVTVIAICQHVEHVEQCGIVALHILQTKNEMVQTQEAVWGSVVL